MKETIRIIESEHRSMSAVLHGLKELVRLAGEAGVRPEFGAFRAMVRYIDEYPERFHHPKEDRYLFARLYEKVPASRLLIERLEGEHRMGARLIRELERALMLYEDRWPEGRDELSMRVDEYARFHWDHMHAEEKELLPLAELHFSAADWAVVDAGFSGHADPVAGMKEQNFRALFSRLVNLAPAPVGLGEPWKKSA